MEQVDTIVIGGGIVGLAIARALGQVGRSVLVIEQASHLASETSARNSGVIHAGIYYPPGSLKAQTCVLGNQHLYAYCDARAIPYQRCGKLIVAQTGSEAESLKALMANAHACGVEDLVLLDPAKVTNDAPGLNCAMACWSPSTGIIDPHAFATALETDCLESGTEIVLNTKATALTRDHDAIVVETADASNARFALRARTVINAAGLYAEALTRTLNVETAARSAPRTYWGKGHYYNYTAPVPFQSLIYPMPSTAGLGIHLTRGVDGSVRFGPDVTWSDQPDYTFEDTPERRATFEQAIRRYWPEFQADKLTPDSTGLRPKVAPPGAPASDFLIHDQNDHQVPGYIALYGIESPGLTASLALADRVAALAGKANADPL